MKRQVILPEVTPDDNFNHLSTDWLYTEDLNRENIIDSVTDSKIFKNVWFVDNPVGVNKNYVWVKRNYDTNNDGIVDSSDENWIGPFEVIPNPLNNVFANINSKVDVPVFKDVYIKDDVLYIELNSMTPNLVKHNDTTYIVENMKGEILYKKIHSISNLTKLDFNINNYEISKYEDLIIKVFFRNYNGVLSPLSVYHFDGETELVAIKNNFSSIIIELETKLEIFNKNGNTYTLEILKEDNEIVFTKIDTTADFITLPRFLFNIDEFYTFNIIVDSKIVFNKNVKAKSFNSYNNYIDFKLDHSIKKFNSKNDFTYSLSEPLDNNVTLFYVNEEKKLYFFIINFGESRTIYSKISFDDDLDNKTINFIHLKDNLVCVEVFDKNGVKINYLLHYNIENFSVRLVKRFTYENTSLNKVSFSHNVFNVYNGNLYSLEYIDEKIYLVSFNIDEETKRIMTELPEQDSDNYIISYIDYENILVTSSSKNDNDEFCGVYIFNLRKEKFNSIDSFPEEYEDSNLSSIQLPNNKILFLDVSGKNENYLLFDKETLSFSSEDKDADYEYGTKIYITNLNEIITDRNSDDGYNYFT